MANYTKYEYQGRILGKSRLVQAVVEDYCADNPSVSIEEFEFLTTPDDYGIRGCC